MDALLVYTTKLGHCSRGSNTLHGPREAPLLVRRFVSRDGLLSVTSTRRGKMKETPVSTPPYYVTDSVYPCHHSPPARLPGRHRSADKANDPLPCSLTLPLNSFTVSGFALFFFLLTLASFRLLLSYPLLSYLLYFVLFFFCFSILLIICPM